MMRFKKTSEPGKLPAGLLAILVHLAFFALLVFGVTWQTKSPAPVTVDVWSSLPAPAKTPTKEPPTEYKPAPPPPDQKPKLEPTPKPKAEPAPTPKPDIALKQEKLKREQEKKKLENEKRKEEEQKKQKQEEERNKKQEKLKEEQAKKLATQKEAQAKAAANAAANKAAEASNALVASYIDRIKAKIERSTQVPENITGRPHAEFKLVLLPTGELLSATLVKPSGNSAYDEAVARGIKRAEPLPLPPDPALFPRFRELTLPFTHEK